MANQKDANKIQNAITEIITKAAPEDRALYMTAANAVVNAYSMDNRARLASAAGESYGGDRNIYNALGYKKEITFDDYYQRFERGDIAKRIITAYPDATWRETPEVHEDKGADETKFEKEWDQLCNDFSIYHYLSRVDMLSGIGQYAVLLIGYDDGKELSEPVEKAKGLLYLRPYMESNAEISSYVKDSQDSRFGLPETYKINLSSTKAGDATTTMNKLVHHTRVLHVAEELVEDDIFGQPRLKCVFNRLHDLDLISGGSAEMFWRGGFPGFAFVLPPDVPIASVNTDTMNQNIHDYVHNLKRYMNLQGVDVQSLSQQVADPKNNFEVLLRLISAATNIPARILTGSERGQLASTQDEKNWNNRVEERMKNYAGPMILRPFVNNLMKAEVLPTVENFEIDWPSMFELDEKDEAEVNNKKTDTMSKYVNANGADAIMPPDMFRAKMLDMTEDEIKQANAYMDELKKQEEEEVDLYEKELDQIDSQNPNEGNKGEEEWKY